MKTEKQILYLANNPHYVLTIEEEEQYRKILARQKKNQIKPKKNAKRKTRNKNVVVKHEVLGLDYES